MTLSPVRPGPLILQPSPFGWHYTSWISVVTIFENQEFQTWPWNRGQTAIDLYSNSELDLLKHMKCVTLNVALDRYGLARRVTLIFFSARSVRLDGCTREGYLQDGCHGVPLSSRSGTSVPRWPSHHILRRRFWALSAFCKPTPAHRTSLSFQHIPVLPSGVFDRWSDGLELAAWRAQRSGVWFWQF